MTEHTQHLLATWSEGAWTVSTETGVHSAVTLAELTNALNRDPAQQVHCVPVDEPSRAQARRELGARELDPGAQARAERWQAENREAFDSANRYVEEYGLPLAKYRVF